ncbi:hypothetical protein [Hyalangium rubrum]|uniref:Uncharacterized protein n=1 Tax=Hyalangium rubrum TaxID=3103134 RepID=A0ABU5H9M1_9BACT|nr:hypothetical protein [Hyalangium sp. s54d21]MDY7230179.1 hypothetical protein [Hyalangium sp. s54d21]
MGKERAGPMEALRNLALTLNRLAVREATSGAVRGAADGLRQELPEFDAQLRALLEDALTVLGRLVHQAAEREGQEPGAAARTLATSAMQGALEVLEQEWQDGGMPLHSFVERLNRLLDEVVAFAHSRTEEIHSPGERAQAMARGVVTAAMEGLHGAVPTFAEDARLLAPLGAEVASKVGQGLVEGVASKLQENSDPFEKLLERAGRGLVRGIAAGIREELASSPGASREALGASLETLVERSAAATVRGAGGALSQQWRRTSRELTNGALEALGTVLRRPLRVAVGAGSALVALSLLSMRWRRA